MNFKSIRLSAMLLAGTAFAVMFSTAPAKALSLQPGDTLQITDGNFSGVAIKNSLLDFGANGVTPGKFSVVTTMDATTGGFRSLVNAGPEKFVSGLIKDLSLPNPGASQRSEFLTFLLGNGSKIFFDLNPITLSPTFSSIPGPFDAYSQGVFEGVFRNTSGSTFASGNLTVLLADNAVKQLQMGNSVGDSDYLLSLKVTDVPTPALLPGLVGMGVAALRKRKSEEETVEEAVEV